MSETTGTEGQQTGSAGEQGSGQQEQGKSFTQAEVDQIVKDRAERIYKQRVGDLDIKDLKARAEGAKTLEERLASLETENASIKSDALRSRVQAKHGISDEDAALFLTGTNEETLTAQAKRLAERESERKKRNNTVPREGNQPSAGTSDLREFTRGLFGGDA